MDILQAARLAVMNMMGQHPQPTGMMPGVIHGGSTTAPPMDPRAAALVGGYGGPTNQDAEWREMIERNALERDDAARGHQPARLGVMQQNMGMGQVDPQGMDPEMAALMAQEQARLGKQRAMYAPQTMGGR